MATQNISLVGVEPVSINRDIDKEEREKELRV